MVLFQSDELAASVRGRGCGSVQIRIPHVDDHLVVATLVTSFLIAMCFGVSLPPLCRCSANVVGMSRSS
jgi:hypothetical protein